VPVARLFESAPYAVEFLTTLAQRSEEELSVSLAPELEAHILRYYHVEKWRVGTIARQPRVHGGTVRRVLAQAGLPRIGSVQRPSLVEPYLPFIRQTLEKFPSLTASRLYAMVRERGYRVARITSAISSACTDPVPARKPTCACAHCLVSKGKLTGVISVTSTSVVPVAR
jgi:hypothetical protein